MLLHEVLTLDRKLVGLDLETTGIDHQTSGICSMALEVMYPDGRVDERYTLINPLMRIPADVTAIHGITNEMVKDSPTFVSLAPKLARALIDCDFAGYSVGFDLRQLAEEFRRAGIDWDYEGARIIDGYHLWRLTSPRTLVDYASTNGVPLTDEHNALADIRASTRSIAAHLSRCATLPRNVDDLHKLCNPDAFDADGKLRYVNGALCFAFGAHRGKPVNAVPARYLEWVIKSDFSAKVKRACQDALDR